MSLAAEDLIKEFLAFFLEEVGVLEMDLRRLLGPEILPVDWNVAEALAQPPGQTPPIVCWQVLKGFRRAGECGLAVMAAMTADPGRADTTLMRLHQAFAAVTLQFNILEYCLEKGRRFPWCEEHRRRGGTWAGGGGSTCVS